MRPGAIQWLCFTALLAVTGLVPGAPATVVRAQEPVAAAPEMNERKPLRGRIVDEGGRPVEGATVSARPLNTPDNYVNEVSGHTNREGVFIIPDLEPGLYSLWVRAEPLFVFDGIPERGASPGQSLTIRMARGAVITGKVVDREGQLLTGLRVEPIRVRDEDGLRYSDAFWGYRGGRTDDRGVYRIWGLKPGTYVLAAGYDLSYDGEPKFLSDRLRTFHPSSSRAGATEVTVRAGDEVGNTDITFRGDTGYRVSGTVVGVPNRRISPYSNVELYRAGTTATEREAMVQIKGDSVTFRFESLEDGDYELMARSWDGDENDTSDRRTVRIRGADVTGIKLELQPTSTLTGRIEVRPAKPDQSCGTSTDGKSPPPLKLDEIVVRTRRVDSRIYSWWTVGPKASGEFTVKSLSGPQYRLGLEFSDEDAYLEVLDRPTGSGEAKAPVAAKGNSKPPPDAKSPVPSAIGRDGVFVTRGKTVAGVRFVVARGAARVRGRITPAKVGEPLPSRARLVLVPSDVKQKDDVIHYYEVDVEDDATFDVRNVAPGEYFVVTRTFPNDDRPTREIFPASWDPKERADLRAAAEKAGVRLTLLPCQRLESAVVTMTQRQE